MHGEESEYDYFTVVDDLHEEGSGRGAADHIDESELVCGLFYGYVVIDRNTLLGNVGGDSTLAGEIVRRLVRLICTVSPGARKGATAPYSYANWLLIEAGDEQPRSLAEAFRMPSKPLRESAQRQLNGYLGQIDKVYGNSNERIALSVDEIETAGAAVTRTLNEAAKFAQKMIVTGGR